MKPNIVQAINKYHQQHGHYPNNSQLATILGVGRRKIASDLRKLEAQGQIMRVKPRQVYTGDYELI
jgi:DeoR/GlpR family transcriptional regulator of sugar metabolism